MPETGFTATDLDLISILKAIPDARMRRAGFVFLPGPCCCWPCSGSSAVAKACEIWSVSLDATMWCLARSWGFELQQPPSDSFQGLRQAGLRPGSRYVFPHVDVVALCTAVRAWTVAQFPGGASLRTTPEALLQLARQRWSLESWHWIRDTQLHEDAHRYRGNSAGAMASLRTAAINWLRFGGIDSIGASMQTVTHDISPDVGDGTAATQTCNDLTL